MRFFMPKQIIFYDLLLKVSKTLQEMADLFAEFTRNFKNFGEYVKKAKDLEHKADSETHEIIEKLNKTFITPFDREDIYMLAHQMDDIIDLMEDVIHNICIYQIKEKFTPMDEFAKLIVEASKCLDKLLHHLQKQKHTEELVAMKIRIHELEDKADAIFNSATTEMFKNGGDPIEIMKRKDILEGMEDTMDEFQRVSDLIEGIVVKSG